MGYDSKINFFVMWLFLILLPICPVAVNEEGVSASPSGITEYKICSVVQ